MSVARVYIDISVFTTDAAFGMVSGDLDLPVTPQVGDKISFSRDIAGRVQAHCGTPGVPFGLVEVTARIIDAWGEGNVILELEDITAATVADAEQLVSLLEQHYGLLSDVWEQ